MNTAESIKKVLVLLSTYNGQRFLVEQLESLRHQKEIEVFCLARDDGSTDRTVEILDEYASVWERLTVIKGENLGCGASFTELLKAAGPYVNQVDYLAFCDQDDVWFEGKLTAAVSALETMPADQPSLYCSNLTLVDENLKMIANMYPEPVAELTKGNALVERFGTGCTMVFNKKAREMYLSHLPSVPILHDRWIYLICLFFGNVHYDHTPRILYRQHEKNAIGGQSGFFDKWKSRMRSFKKLDENPREQHAKELLRIFRSLLTEEDTRLIKIVAGYRENLPAKLRFFLAPRRYDLRMRSRERNFWLRMRILFESV